MSTEHIRAAVFAAHEIGHKKALDSVLAKLGRSIAETLFPSVTKAAAPPWPDPHAALLLAQIDHLLYCVRHHQDYGPGLRALHALWDDPRAFHAAVSGGGTPARVRKDYAPGHLKAAQKAPVGGVTLTNHESGQTQFYPGGQWIPAQDIENATPESRAKLEAATAPAGKNPMAAAPAAPTRDTSRSHVAAIAKDILTNPAGRTPDKYRDLAEATIGGFEAGHLSVMDLSALRLRLTASLIDQQHTPEAHRTIGALLSYASNAIKTMQPGGRAQKPGERPAEPTSSPNEQSPSAEPQGEVGAAPQPPAAPNEEQSRLPTLVGRTPAPAPPPVSGPPQPGSFAVVPTESLSIDPARFQFKMKVNERGVTKELENVRQFNPDLAGVIAVWHDPSDGKTYVVNGHHRFELARRTGHPELAVRYLGAKDAREARALGALINIAEGRGTALDAAKFLRNSHRGIGDLTEHGLSPDSPLLRDATILTHLNAEAFNRLVRGGLELSTALAVAKHVRDGRRQEKLFKLIDKNESAGRHFTQRHVEEMARQMASAPETEVTEQTLFGDDTRAEDTFLERSEMASYVRGELAKEHGDYSALSSERRADATKEAGNTLAIEENKRRASEAEVHKRAFDTLAYRKGAVSEALDDGAVALKKARTKKEKENVRKQTLAAVRNALAGTVSGRPAAADGSGVGGVGDGGAAAGGAEPAGGSAENPADSGRTGAGAGGLSAPAWRESLAPDERREMAAPSEAAAESRVEEPPSPDAAVTTKSVSDVMENPAAGKEPHEMTLQEFRKSGKVKLGPDADHELDVAQMQHRNAVAEAAKAGRPIPAKVLQEYPEIARRAGVRGPHSPRPGVRKRGRGTELEREQERYAQREAANVSGRREEADAVKRARTEAGGEHPKEEPVAAPRGGEEGKKSPHEMTHEEYVERELSANPKMQNALKNSPHNAGVERESLEPDIKSDHELAVANAIDAGEEVPASVLADYPRQAERYAEKRAERPSAANPPSPNAPVETPQSVADVLADPAGAGGQKPEAAALDRPIPAEGDGPTLGGGEAAPVGGGESEAVLRDLSAHAIPRSELQKTHRNMKKYSDLAPHGYTISHWLNPSDPDDQVLEYNPTSGEGRKTGKYRLTAKNGDEVDAIHDALGLSRAERRAPKPSRLDEASGNVLSVREAKRAAEESTPPNEKPDGPAHVALANDLAERLRAGGLERNELWRRADEHFGGTRAEGKYGPSEAYDALEAGLNKSLAGQTDPTADLASAQEQARALERVVNGLPTQTNRSGNKESHQQFSTPPHYAFAANWIANIKPGEQVLEPSAGTGSLAVHARNAGASVVTNELDPKRADFLRDQFGPESTHTENAEQIAGILPKRGVKPSVVVMNPPFSQTAGRMGDKKELLTGSKHIAEAGATLAPGGRLVAIVGEGMRPGAKRYAPWFRDMAANGFTLRANVGVSGGEYKKYGTQFGTRMLVFDKVPPSESAAPPVTGDAADIPDLMSKLEGVRNDRPEVAGGAPGEPVRGEVPPGDERPADQSASAPNAGGGMAAPVAAEESGVAGVPGGTARKGRKPRGGRPGVGGESAGVGVRATEPGGERAAGDAGPVSDSVGAPGPTTDGTEAATDGGGGGQAPGGEPLQQSAPALPGVRPPRRIEVSPVAAPEVGGRVETSGGSDSLYAAYRPARMKVAGAVPHANKLVESAAMAAVQPPAPTYQPHLSPDVVENAVREVKNPDGTVTKKPIGISEAGLESIVYAGQAHNSWLQAAEGEQPHRRGFFIGDGTGAGKGRQIAGIMLDNLNQGKPKHVWVSEKDKLFNDARRDWADMGQDPADLIHWDDLAKKGFKHEKGTAFVTYSTLRSGPKDQAKPRNVDKLIEWLGPDFDGVIAFDEAHGMGNADDTQGSRGVVKASQQAQAGMKLQRALPKAKVVYVSATGATKPENLAYGDRLGLWGRGTAFANKAEFLQAMDKGGTSAMEAVAQSMKARGLYLARSLSYDGVQTDRLQHHLSDEQKYVYDNLAEGWQNVLQNIDAAIESIAGGKENVRHAGMVAAAAKSQFQGAQQRFFNQVITSMMVPTLIQSMERDLKEGRAPVVQLVNTMEAATKRALSAREDGEDLEAVDISPRQMLVEYLKNSFPVHRLQPVTDDDGNTRMELVKDSEGNPVEDPGAVARRDALIEKAMELKIPQSPLDQIVNHFGHESVAEATGRTVRLVKKVGDDGVVRLAEERRDPKKSNEGETRDFQGGRKKIMVFSEAGGTGASYHADKNAGNRAQRSHYLLQPGWRADKAVQGLGRTHRTNQSSAPIFHLMEAPDIPGQKRFVSTIARRLGQLGALTRGQAQTGGGVELFSANDNLESKEAQAGLEAFINKVKAGGEVNGMGYDELMSKLGFKVDRDAGGGGGWRTRGQSEVPEMRQFLNRVLALKLADQQEVFRQLDGAIQSKTEQASQDGTLDNGVQNFPAQMIVRRGDDETVYRDPETGAEAKLVRATVTRKNPKLSFEAAQKYKPVKFVRNERSGKIWGVYEAAPQTDERGNVVPMYGLKAPTGVQFVPQSQVDDQSYYRSGYRSLDIRDAKPMWDEQHAELPDTIDGDEHFVTGDLLSVWDKLPQDRPKIYRVNLHDGTSIVGRHIPSNQVERTLAALGATQKAKENDFAAGTVHRQVMSGAVAKMANGWTLKPVRVQGEKRIELVGPVGMHRKQLEEDGVKTEKIAYETRHFVPVGEEGEKVLERVMRSRNSPVTEVIPPKRGE